MTAFVGPPGAVPGERGSRRRALIRSAWPTAAAAMVAVLARLPAFDRAPSPDEAGFLLVGAQWDGAGTSLYGDYWVDRPPLLVMIFRLVSMGGGVPALRAVGCVAVLLVVVGCAHAAGLIAGERAAHWAAVTAAALCVSVVGYAVNGEILAAPFVIGGIIAVIRALRAATTGAGVRWAALAGGCAMCAILVKQNFADVAVFGAVAFVLSAVGSDISWPRLLSLGAGATAGAAAALGAVAVWTATHGTSLPEVFDAMYPFRVQAAHTMAAGGGGKASARFVGLAAAAVSSMLVPLMVLAGLDVLHRWRRSPLAWATLSLLGFAAASVLLGGNFWHHYLVGLVVPVSLAMGLLVAEGRFLARPAVGLAIAAAVLAWAGNLAVPHGNAGQTIGTAVGSVARSGDTIVNLYGHADIVWASGLSSPYEHLWSLPVKTLDPDLTELGAVLIGPRAPTWLVTAGSVRSWGLRTDDTAAIIGREYRNVATVCDRAIYLRRGVVRPPPVPVAACSEAGRHSVR